MMVFLSTGRIPLLRYRSSNSFSRVQPAGYYGIYGNPLPVFQQPGLGQLSAKDPLVEYPSFEHTGPAAPAERTQNMSTDEYFVGDYSSVWFFKSDLHRHLRKFKKT